MYKFTEPVVIQFIHPSSEDLKKENGIKPWNTGKHKRNFIAFGGEAISQLGKGPQGYEKISFWGEWESEADICQEYQSPGSFMPHRQIRPVFPSSKPPQIGEGCCSNTDPFVFGNCFKYSNCRQITNNGESSTCLQDLPKGSLILFGSNVEKGDKWVFLLDTVFVVAGKTHFNSTNYKKDLKNCLSKHGKVFEEVTLIPLEKSNPNTNFILYEGAGYDDQIDGMFSFVPCDTNGNQFPKFELDASIVQELSYNAMRTFKVVKDAYGKYVSPQEVWKKVKTAVLKKKLSLGIHFDDVSSPSQANNELPNKKGGH